MLRYVAGRGALRHVSCYHGSHALRSALVKPCVFCSDHSGPASGFEGQGSQELAQTNGKIDELTGIPMVF